VGQNMMSKRIEWTNKSFLFVRVSKLLDFDPLESRYNVLEQVAVIGSTKPTDPLCVYKGENGVQFLTGTDITSYYWFIMQLINSDISAAALKLILTHSIRVYAWVLLHEAGKDSPYIKLRLWWLSNYFEIYLRNTDRITNQHNEVLHEVHQRMQDMAISALNLNQVIHISGNIDLTMTKLEDHDW